MTYRWLTRILLGGLVILGCASNEAQNGSSGDGGADAGDAAAVEDAGDAGPVDPTKDIPVFENGFESDPPTMPTEIGRAQPYPWAVSAQPLIKLDGNRLYALSRYDGLAIVDVTNPASPKLLGRQRLDGVASSFDVAAGHAQIAVDGPAMVSVVDLDVSNPGAIVESGRVALPGYFAAARAVGDRLYVATQETGRCAGCDPLPGVVVTSFKTSGALTKVDSVTSRGTDGRDDNIALRKFGWTDQRLYIGGERWDRPLGSPSSNGVVETIDLTDVTGKLTRGATVTVDGGVAFLPGASSIDEVGGVLRVVSEGYKSVHVSSFQVTSASQLTPLGHVELALPEFATGIWVDASRAYVQINYPVSSIQIVDISSPAQPKLAGMIPRLGQLAPRGDRLIVFDDQKQGTIDKALAVSLIDVSEVNAPKELSRVSFGSDQVLVDSFAVFDAAGLIAVPWAPLNECGAGIQLIDYSSSSLKLRGFEPMHGVAAHTALLAGNRLLGMAPRHVETFDITQRDTPSRLGAVTLSNATTGAVDTTTHVATVTTDPFTSGVSLALTPKESADDTNLVGSVALPFAPPISKCSGPLSGVTPPASAELMADGDVVWVVAVKQSSIDLFTADASTPAAPRLLAQLSSPYASPTTQLIELPYGTHQPAQWPLNCVMLPDGIEYAGCGAGVAAGTSLLKVGKKLVYLEGGQTTRRVVHVIDLSDPSHPKEDPPVILTDSRGRSLLHAMGNLVLTSRFVDSPTTPGKVRFYVDRIDISGTARLVDTVNVPGQLMLADATSSRLVTVDNRGVERDFKLADVSGTTVALRQTFPAPFSRFTRVRTGEDRIYVTRDPAFSGPFPTDSNQPLPPVATEGVLAVVGGVRDGTLELASISGDGPRWPLAVNGTNVAVLRDGGLAVYDTSTPTAKLLFEQNIVGVDYGTPALLTPNRLVLPLYDRGLRTVSW